MDATPASRRIRPDHWLGPLDVAATFPHPARPLEVDMGCGKGRFLLARAGHHPDINFLGVDRLLGRIRKIDRKAVRAGLDNVRLLRADGFYTATYLIPAAAVSAYYIFFPDPWPKVRHHRHRLFNEAFMRALARTLRPDGVVHVATDHQPYFDEIRAIFLDDPQFEPLSPWAPEPSERTDFELLYLDRKPIGRLTCRRRP